MKCIPQPRLRMANNGEEANMEMANELRLNDSRILKKRTQYFNTQLVKNLELLSFVLIILGYLNTLSVVEFAVRLSQQFIIIRPFPKDSSEMRQMSGNVKKLISRSIIQVVVAINVGIILIHLILSSNTADHSGAIEYSHGGWTLQVIGESKFTNAFFYKVFILFNDLAIFAVHVLIAVITCLKNEGLVATELGADEATLQEAEPLHDGYTGNVTVVEVDPKAVIRQLREFKREAQASTETGTAQQEQQDANFSMPGGFQMFSNFTVDDFV